MIENINEKLSGSLPVTIDELFELVSSHGRIKNFVKSNGIYVLNSEPNEKYPLENLDVSQIDDFSDLFRHSPYNGDLSKWNMSNAIYLSKMFSFSKFNNDSLNSWNVSNVKVMIFMFFESEFNGDLSNWKTNQLFNVESMFAKSKFNGDISFLDLNKITNFYRIFSMNENFEKKYNNSEPLPISSQDMENWLKNNREKIREINISKEEVLDFFSFNYDIEKDIK